MPLFVVEKMLFLMSARELLTLPVDLTDRPDSSTDCTEGGRSINHFVSVAQRIYVYPYKSKGSPLSSVIAATFWTPELLSAVLGTTVMWVISHSTVVPNTADRSSGVQSRFNYWREGGDITSIRVYIGVADSAFFLRSGPILQNNLNLDLVTKVHIRKTGPWFCFKICRLCILNLFWMLRKHIK